MRSRACKIDRVFAIPFLIFLAAILVNGQVKPRFVDQGVRYENQPLKVLGCQIGRLSFADCSRIEADNDWWLDLRFVVKNVSDKTISGLYSNFLIDKQNEMRTAIGVNLIPAGGWGEILDGSGKPTGRFGYRIKPGEVFFLRSPEGETKRWKEQLELRDAVDIPIVRMEIRNVYFTDGTMWWFGRETKLTAGQTDDLSRKLITYKSYYNKVPVTITGIEANGRTVKLGEPFMANEPEWLKDLTIRFQNNAERTIKSLVFYFTLYEGHPERPPTSYPVAYGVSFYRTPEEPPVVGSMKSGENGIAVIEKRLYDSLIRNNQIWKSMGQQTTAEVHLAEIIFTDGIKWENGCYHKPDPDRWRRWLSECMK